MALSFKHTLFCFVSLLVHTQMLIIVLTFSNFFLCSGEDNTYTGCQGEFHSKCRCDVVNYENEGEMFVTNCTDSNFTNATILAEVNVETEILIFRGNNMPILNEKLFGKYASFDKLKKVDLSNNHIKQFHTNTFDSRVHNVIELNLGDNYWKINDGVEIFNNFESLEKLILINAFNKEISTSDILKGLDHQFEKATQQKLALQNLSQIHLENNLFEHFNDDTFMCYLHSLSHLYLSNNRITHFQITRRCSHNLQFLDLNGNQIKHLSGENIHEFTYMPRLQLDLDNNIFYCDCSIKNTTNWLKNTELRIANKDKYTCIESSPADLKGKSLLSVEDKELQCISPRPPEDNYSRAGIVILAVVLAIVAGLAAGLIYLNRASVKRCLNFSIEPIRQKFEYSSIGGRREEHEVDV